MLRTWRFRGPVALIMSAALLMSGVQIEAGGCSGANNAYGPCSDTGATTDSGGPGWAGACDDMFLVFVGGNCSGGAGSGGFNCTDCTVQPKTMMQKFASSSVGSVQVAACYASWVVCCSAGAGACGAACTAACSPSVFTTPVGMAACLAACGAACAAPGASFCNLLYDTCTKQCLPVGNPVPSGNLSTCT